METEKKIELKGIPGFKDDDWAVIKKFSFREKTKLRGKAISVGADNQTPVVDFGELQFWTVIYGIKDASFLKGKIDTEDKVKYFESVFEGGDHLFNEVNQFNNLIQLQVMQKK